MILFEPGTVHRVGRDGMYHPSRPKLICKQQQHWTVRQQVILLTWTGSADREQETIRNDKPLCHPQRCPRHRANGQLSPLLLLRWRCMWVPSPGLKCGRRNRRSKPARLLSSGRWRNCSKRMGPVLLRRLGPQLIDAFSAEAAFLSAGGYHHYIGLPLGRAK